MIGDARPLQRAKLDKQRPRIRKRPFRRRCQEGKLACAPFGKLKREAGEIAGFNFGRRKLSQRTLLALGPEAIADPVRNPARTAPALLGLGMRDTFGDQT